MPIRFNFKDNSFQIDAPPVFIETLEAGIWIVSLDGKTKYINSSLSKILGYSKEEMLNNVFFDFIHNPQRALAIERFEGRKKGISASYEYHLKQKNGDLVKVAVATNPLKNDSGDIVGALAAVTRLKENSLNQELDNLDIITCNNLSLLPYKMELVIEGKSFDLSALTLRLLQYFLKNQERVISREELMKNVWQDGAVNDRLIDAHIVMLRKKLRKFQGKLKTVYGIGYILKTK